MGECNLDFTDISWKAKNKNGLTQDKKLTKYTDIVREGLDIFEISYKKRNLFTVKHPTFKAHIKGRTLIHRLKSKGSMSMGGYKKSGSLNIQQRILIIAILQKNKDSTKNKKYTITQNTNNYQTYEFDPLLSEIYYIFDDETVEKHQEFGVTSPYGPLELTPEELSHLNGSCV